MEKSRFEDDLEDDLEYYKSLLPKYNYEFCCGDRKTKTIIFNITFQRLKNPFYLASISLSGFGKEYISSISIFTNNKKKQYDDLIQSKKIVTLNQFFNGCYPVEVDKKIILTIAVNNVVSDFKRKIKINFKRAKHHYFGRNIKIPIISFDTIEIIKQHFTNHQNQECQ